MAQRPSAPLSLLAPPYHELLPIDPVEGFPADPRVLRGVALVWRLGVESRGEVLEGVAGRPGGLALLVLLPPSGLVSRTRSRVLEVLEDARPQAVLPFHPAPDVRELRLLLRTAPQDLAGEVLDYLWWRGLRLDPETRRIIRRTVELSDHLRTLAALARGVYMSRRALGRRFQQLGLPVPSHWLQFCRLLRATLGLQNSTAPLSAIARSLGYPDGFTLSSQMDRLVGVRPSVARERLGWEWFLEAWLQREWESGGLRVALPGLASPRSGDCPPGARRGIASGEGTGSGSAA